ncbi:MAG TPA: GAF domain-containing protein [Candidatus Limnocylindrales bacterium]|nr:GAF domain-containing protein [Candidatus Limnocylindrales bacterium]
MGGNWRLNDVPAAVVVYDDQGRALEANEAAYSLLGLSPRDLIGSDAEDAGWLVIESAEGPIAVHPVVAAIKAAQAIRGVLVRAHRPGGSDVWLQVDAVPDSASGRIVASFTDVTHLIAHSRTSSRSAGDHIVEEVTDNLANARMEPRAILGTVTRSLARLRPGTWVASLIGKDPTEVQVVVGFDGMDSAEDLGSTYVESMKLAGSLESTPIATRVIESGQPLVLPDVSIEGLGEYMSDDVRSYLNDHPWMAPNTRLGVVVVPMRARGATIGTLGLFEKRTSNPLTEKDTAWVQAIADRTGLAVENAQLYEDAVNRLERLAALQSVSLAVSASPDLRLTLKVILDHVVAQLKVDAADVLLLDETDNTLALSASTGFRATAMPDLRLPADDGMPGRVVTSRRIETVTALSAFSQFRRRSLFAREGFKAYGAVPLVSRGKLLGALEVFHRSALSPDQEWHSFLDALGSVAAVAIDSATMQERLRTNRIGQGPRVQRGSPDMSRTESEIMRMAVEGLTNREIAARVHLSQNTVKFHMRQILQKTGASNRTELAHEAAKQGWL